MLSRFTSGFVDDDVNHISMVFLSNYFYKHTYLRKIKYKMAWKRWQFYYM